VKSDGDFSITDDCPERLAQVKYEGATYQTKAETRRDERHEHSGGETRKHKA
jgi:hypothetical protein